MGSWSLEAFVESKGTPLEVETIANTFVAISGDQNISISDWLNPFSGERLGLRLAWPDWLIKVMVRQGPDVVADAEDIANSGAPPAKTRRRLSSCDYTVRVIFGSDDARVYTNTIIEIAEYLNELSEDRTYDPQQRRFWPTDR
jgi:hypothetical protein